MTEPEITPEEEDRMIKEYERLQAINEAAQALLIAAMKLGRTCEEMQSIVLAATKIEDNIKKAEKWVT